MNPQTLTLISGILLVLLIAFVAWRVRATTPSRGRHEGSDTKSGHGGCCGPSPSTDHEKHEHAAH